VTDPTDRPDWSRVRALFQDALEWPAAERAAFLDRACEGDDALRAEVGSLIDAHEQAGDALDTPPDPLGPSPGAGLPPGTVAEVGHYRLIDVLGEGGMGVVYLAEDTRLGRTVALKALPGQFAVDATRRERLRREARAAAALSHPGIAVVYALEEIDEHLYLAVEYVPGHTLRSELEPGPLPPARAVETGIALARILAAAHARGIIHRDLKPENVMRTPSGELKILDFGLARSLEDASAGGRLTADGGVFGTPAYMAPEQIRGGPDDPRSDLFSLGAMIYEAAAGVSPFGVGDATSTIARVIESDPPPLPVPPDASASDAAMLRALDRVLRVCLAKTPSGRFGSASDLAAALEAVAGHRPDLGQHLPAVGGSSARNAFWWWQFHQGAASLGYVVLLLPVWLARQETRTLTSLLLSLLALAAGLAASFLRLHVWFAVRSYPAEGAGQRARARPWIRLADTVLALTVLSAGLAVVTEDAGIAATLVGIAVAIVVAFAVVEPATSRAAFGDD